MKRWFARLPIHQKLVLMALVVTTAALVVATLGLAALDLWRYKGTARDDIASLARVIAENIAAAVRFTDKDATEYNLATVRVRPTVLRSCVYLPDGSLYAGYARSPELACPSRQPSSVPWRVVAGTAPVRSNDRVVGTVYLERDLSEFGARMAVTGLTGLGVLFIAAAVALALAQRMHRVISRPITQLASAALAMNPEGSDLLADVQAGEDEIGDLVRALTEMLRRVRDANARLVESNEALRHQETEREQLLLREREASRLKDEFLAAVSHELRTPLNAIAGWVQILTTTAVSEQTVAKALASIARNAKAQTRVIEDLVDVSRIVTGKLSLRVDPVDLRDVVSSAVDVIGPAAESKGVSVDVEVPNEACFVNGDRDRLQQIAWNLLSNAIKFTPTGGAVSLSLRATNRDFILEVTDTGVGVPASFLPHVFDRFRQADGSMTREHGGLGLGLAIVKELAEVHGGEARAASDGAGQGSTFSVRLPQMAGLGGPDPPPVALRHVPSAPLAGVRVLAVDDDADALEILSASLAGSGADVRVAASGADAIRAWDREPADVLICDLAMPHLNGFDVLSRIRSRDREHGRVTPAIALTAHATSEYQRKAQVAGFDFHVAKPCDLADLVLTIRAALAGSG